MSSIILISIFSMLYITHVLLTPEINVSSEQVSNIINFWTMKHTALSGLTLALLIRSFIKMCFIKYHKKPQGNIVHRG